MVKTSLNKTAGFAVVLTKDDPLFIEKVSDQFYLWVIAPLFRVYSS